MSLESQIRSILFEIGRDIKIHRIDDNNTIIEIDYDKYTEKLKSILGEGDTTPGSLE